ncbi:zinc finger translocation-associated protein isoform X1 [Ictalurus punctatus]|uniref:Zinc finger translocation-associated protein isoform X1 n=2 Tax=Ictalurus punctatus TaxID=7998 RepID=A0A2D0R9Q4_ICTPU|nr:zinc finger translocation-associated protein isoform X1 [Ictalurus punctatus]
MEENECRESEPGVQTESLSLIIRDEEEEASPPFGASAQLAAGEDDMTNGHNRDDSQASLITHVDSPGTSYWSVSESPESPSLLSLVLGPSRNKTSPAKAGWASRTGHSRIPGRDHRRYYHEHWRTEYLMDFDPKRNGMICMVCGSSLATLKLSTIKRHIRQKHPDSLLWSASDKEVIRSGWENHLNLETSQTSCADSAIASEPEETLECASETDKPGSAVIVKTESQSEPSVVSSSSAQETQSVLTEILERYVNDSLHAWFRQEFLMEYQAEVGRLVCMVCSRPLPSLHLDHIKRHVLEQHPNSLVYSAGEKHRVLQSWAQSQDSARDYIKTEPDTKDLSVNRRVPLPATEPDSLQHITEPSGGSGRESEDPSHHTPNSRLKKGSPWHLRLDYLVAIGPPSMPGCFCMVCSEELPVVRVSSFRRHIEDCHPETSYLSQREREDIASAWTQEVATEEPETHSQQASPSDAPVKSKTFSIKPFAWQRGIKKEDGERSKIMSAPIIGRNVHYPGKDQRRNYQVRWRMEYLMDYDCRRHGLICMVCRTTLATLKVSTIKRHIQQVHPHSLNYSAEEKQQAVESYSQATLHFVHAENCFSGSDHSHVAQTNTKVEIDQV